MSRPVRLLLVNDYPLVVQGLASMLEPYADRVHVVDLEVGEVGDLPPADVVLFDTFGATDVGLRLRQIAADLPDPRLVVFSWNHDQAAFEEATAAGAVGYLSKQLSAEMLVSALERINGGEVIGLRSNGAESESSRRTTGRDWPGRNAGLTERESEVVVLIAQGLSNDQVAERLFLSINTVKVHIRTAYRKMEVGSRSQAVLWALANGLEPHRQRLTRSD